MGHATAGVKLINVNIAFTISNSVSGNETSHGMGTNINNDITIPITTGNSDRNYIS